MDGGGCVGGGRGGLYNAHVCVGIVLVSYPSIHTNNQPSTAATTTNPTTDNDNDTTIITLHTNQSTKNNQ